MTDNQPDQPDNWPHVEPQDPAIAHQLAATYARVFNPSGDGFVVLGDLMARYLFNSVNSQVNHSFFSGQAEVMKYIQAQIVRGKE